MFNLVECEHDPALMPGWGGWMKCSCTVWRSTVWWVGCSLSFFIWMPGAFRDAPRASLITYRLIGTSIQPPLQKDPDYPFKEAVSSQLYIEIRKCNHENTKEREFNWLYSVIPPMGRGGWLQKWHRCIPAFVWLSPFYLSLLFFYAHVIHSWSNSNKAEGFTMLYILQNYTENKPFSNNVLIFLFAHTDSLLL